MFDANYFRTALPGAIKAAGGSPVVEVALLNGHVHRVRCLGDVGEGYVSFVVHQVRGDLSHERPRYDGGPADGESVRATVAYDAIAAVVLDPAPDKIKGRPGFTSS